MTLGELIEKANDMVRQYGETLLDVEVYGTSDYGDHCHTQQLIELNNPRLINPRETAYSETGLALPKDDNGDDEYFEDEDKDAVVVF